MLVCDFKKINFLIKGDLFLILINIEIHYDYQLYVIKMRAKSLNELRPLEQGLYLLYI